MHFAKKLSTRDQNILIILPFILFGFISYQFLYPLTSHSLSNAQNSLTIIENGYNESKEFVKTFSLQSYNKRVETLDKQIAKNQTILQQFEEGLTKINSKYSSLNQELSWVNLLGHITQKSKEYSISLGNISDINTTAKELNFKLEGQGGYKNILMFINSLEAYNPKLKVSKLQISEATKIKFSLLVTTVQHSL